MKIFSDAKTLSPSAARNCLLMNLFATPGLGSLMGGRILAGLGQLILFLVAFAFVGIWFYRTMKEYYSLMGEDIPLQVSYSRYFLFGFAFAAVSWLWSLVTSLAMVSQAKANAPPPGSVPPRLTK